ncbi:MAG TPA: lytic murein transglycosylase B [Casimicrobiaceae bacterium]|jgi:membrane-bound lytic murein transglycosylase B|nr:lytic murein transglycosylase B [Casimicrobiaceae bacterium]
MSADSDRRGVTGAWLALLFALAGVALAAPAAAEGDYARRPEVRAFIAELAADEGFDAGALRRLFAQARYLPKVIAAMSRPVVSPPKWYEYAPRFLDPERVDAGLAYWREHATAFSRAEDEFGVPQEVIVAILGVETYYGQNLGSYPVFDSLTTLAFDYPRRAEFFKSELKEFLLWTREQGIPPLVPKGSYAGAIGPAQFMPGSIRAYGLDFNGDGGIDLAGDADDAIGSVAQFLSRHGWVRGQPVMEPARIDAKDPEAGVLGAFDEGITDRRPLADWVREGVTGFAIPGDLAPDAVGLLMLEEADAPSYWLVFNNWYVLTRYNRSRLYAAAVWELAQALKDAAAPAT